MTTDHITLKSGFYKQISQAFEVFEEGNVAFRQVAQEKSKPTRRRNSARN